MLEMNRRHQELPRLAAIVIGRNEGERLRRCLSSVSAMNYPSALVDVIYVDSQSTDCSMELAKEMGARTISLEGKTTAGRARNAGWKIASADFILFLDGDTILDPQFVLTALPLMLDASVAGVWGNRRELHCADSVYNAVLNLEWHATPGLTLYFGGDALVRREALEQVNGFSANLIAGEEPDLCRRIRDNGYTILHIDVPMTMHDLNMHYFTQYWRRSVRTGYAYAQVSSMYAHTSDPLWLDVSRRNVSRGFVWIVMPVTCLAVSLWLRSALPILVGFIIGIFLVLRTMAGMRQKDVSRLLKLTYGIHSHFQHIPILFGQILFWMDKWSRKEGTIIEYR